jgi:hypothetical protein
MKPLLLSQSFVVLCASTSLVVVACSSSNSTPAPEKKDVQLACDDMCRAGGFTNATKDEGTAVTNCYCSVGNASAKIDDTTCSKMCSDIGKSKGTPFGTNTGGNPDSCKCE